MTAAYARSITKDALNTTPHISSKASDSEIRVSKYSNKTKRPRLGIDRPDLELQLAAIQSELSKDKIFSEISCDELKAVKASLSVVSANKDKILNALPPAQLSSMIWNRYCCIHCNYLVFFNNSNTTFANPAAFAGSDNNCII